MAVRFDFDECLDLARHNARSNSLHHGNPAFAHLVDTLGFDRQYVRADGPYLWDAEGRKVLDCLAGYGAVMLGRNHPVVRDALVACLHSGPPNWVRFEHNPLAGQAARMLKEACGPGLDSVFFTNSGTEGVEAAIKMARRHTGRPGLVAWSDAFHGLTYGALALNGSSDLREGFGPMLPGGSLVPFGDLEALERTLAGGAVAAVIVEPVQGKTLRALPRGALAEVHRLCRTHGALLVADEVQSGCGRTGAFLATHHDHVQADIVVLSKALSGGVVPVGAVLVRRDVWNSTFPSMDQAVVHSSTFHEGVLAMTAVMATLQVIREDRLVERASQLGEALHARIAASTKGLRCVQGLHGAGCMVGVEINADEVPSLQRVPLISSATRPLIGQAATMALLSDHNVLAQTTGARRAMLKFLPPLTITQPDVDWMADAVGAVCRRLQSGLFFEALGEASRNTAMRVLRL